MGSIEGVVENLKKTVEFGNFKKREFVLRDSFKKKDGEEVYNHYKIQTTNDGIEMLNDVKVGDTVKVSYFVRGNKWIDKQTGAPKKNDNGEDIIFVNLDAKEIEKIKSVEPAKQQEEKPPQQAPQEDGENDLPF